MCVCAVRYTRPARSRAYIPPRIDIITRAHYMIYAPRLASLCVRAPMRGRDRSRYVHAPVLFTLTRARAKPQSTNAAAAAACPLRYLSLVARRAGRAGRCGLTAARRSYNVGPACELGEGGSRNAGNGLWLQRPNALRLTLHRRAHLSHVCVCVCATSGHK